MFPTESLPALQILAEDEGYDTNEQGIWALVEELALRSVQPGVCHSCKAITSACEPDMTNGWCHGCGNYQVQSLGTLSGMV
jgi:hypothetical protein